MCVVQDKYADLAGQENLQDIEYATNDDDLLYGEGEGEAKGGERERSHSTEPLVATSNGESSDKASVDKESALEAAEAQGKGSVGLEGDELQEVHVEMKDGEDAPRKTPPAARPSCWQMVLWGYKAGPLEAMDGTIALRMRNFSRQPNFERTVLLLVLLNTIALMMSYCTTKTVCYDSGPAAGYCIEQGSEPPEDYMFALEVPHPSCCRVHPTRRYIHACTHQHMRTSSCATRTEFLTLSSLHTDV